MSIIDLHFCTVHMGNCKVYDRMEPNILKPTKKKQCMDRGPIMVHQNIYIYTHTLAKREKNKTKPKKKKNLTTDYSFL